MPVSRNIACVLLACIASGVACAQNVGHLGVRVEVLAPVLEIVVTSAQVDFAQQRADAGEVVLDPETGEISAKVDGSHQLGIVQITGHDGTQFTMDVIAPSQLKGQQDAIAFGFRWAQSSSCGGAAYEEINTRRAFTGRLGENGRTCVRFGGAISLHDASTGLYEGAVQVRLFTL